MYARIMLPVWTSRSNRVNVSGYRKYDMYLQAARTRCKPPWITSKRLARASSPFMSSPFFILTRARGFNVLVDPPLDRVAYPSLPRSSLCVTTALVEFAYKSVIRILSADSRYLRICTMERWLLGNISFHHQILMILAWLVLIKPSAKYWSSS